MGLKRYLKPKSIVMAAVSPAAAVGVLAKTIAPKSSVSDLVATASPASVPLIANDKIKTAAITGYSVAAIAGAGVAAATAYGIGGGAAATVGATKGLEAGLSTDAAGNFLAGDIDPFAGDVPSLYESSTPAASGFSVTDLIKKGAGLLSGVLPSKAAKEKTSGSSGLPGQSLLGSAFDPSSLVLYSILGLVVFIIYKKVVK